MRKLNSKKWVLVALLVACEIILSRFFSIATPIVKIGFGFIPVVITGMLFGPLWAAGAAAMADFMGAILFPISAYFPGFTLTSFLVGMTYGLLLHNKNQWWRIVVAVVIVSVLLHLGLNTYWLYIITGKGYLALLPTRLLQCVVMAPVQILVIRFIAVRLKDYAIAV